VNVNFKFESQFHSQTGIMELALLRMLSKQLDPSGSRLVGKRGESKAVYVAPLRALVQEKVKDWSQRLGGALGINCLELTGDTEPDAGEVEAADVICTTPEKFGKKNKV
jgi:ATP-dependent DNA helicase HFM1/MER3